MPAASQAPGGRLPVEPGLPGKPPSCGGPQAQMLWGRSPRCSDSPRPWGGGLKRCKHEASSGFPISQASPTSEEHPGRPSPTEEPAGLPPLGKHSLPHIRCVQGSRFALKHVPQVAVPQVAVVSGPC